MKAFASLHSGSMGEGNLDVKMKELITLGISIAVRCEGCIAFHVNDALKAGATHQEILEVIGVAIYMGGGPSAMYACEALKAVKEFESRNVTVSNPN
jgi:AhpD family alkylhydroperoxidase